VIPAEPGGGGRVYLCAFVAGAERSWLALDEAGTPISDRRRVREAVSIAALCELAEDTAGGGDVAELRAQLAELRRAEGTPALEEAEEAAAELERTLRPPPRVASAAYLDEIGAATVRLERALGEAGRSPFAEAMKGAAATVEELKLDVEANYRLRLE
jgi:hypothetical protein